MIIDRRSESGDSSEETTSRNILVGFRRYHLKLNEVLFGNGDPGSNFAPQEQEQEQ